MDAKEWTGEVLHNILHSVNNSVLFGLKTLCLTKGNACMLRVSNFAFSSNVIHSNLQSSKNSVSPLKKRKIEALRKASINHNKWDNYYKPQINLEGGKVSKNHFNHDVLIMHLVCLLPLQVSNSWEYKSLSQWVACGLINPSSSCLIFLGKVIWMWSVHWNGPSKYVHKIYWLDTLSTQPRIKRQDIVVGFKFQSQLH